MPDKPQEKAHPHPLRGKDPHPSPLPECRVRGPQYVELAVTSNFTFLTGASHPEELVLRAGELGHAAAAMTDCNTLAGVVRAHVAAKEAGIPLRVGCRLRLIDPPGLSLRVFPTDRAAYGRLCRLLTLGKRRTTKGNCDLTLPDVLEHSAGLAAIVEYPMAGCRGHTPGGWHGQAIALNDASLLEKPDRDRLAMPSRETRPSREKHGQSAATDASFQNSPSARGRLAMPPPSLTRPPSMSSAAPAPGGLSPPYEALREAFDHDRLSLGVARLFEPDDREKFAFQQEIARRFDLPLVAINDVHYHVPARRPLQDVLTCVRQGGTIAEAGFRLFPSAERHLKSAAEMARLFADCPEAVARTLAIAEQAGAFSLDQLRYEYPDEVCRPGLTAQQTLEQLTREGAAWRFPGGTPEKVAALLRHELALIQELNYASYFLTVHDIVVFARSRGILCQGRGAAANSAVCYCLGVTAVDPTRVDMLFERFVSRERDEPPDIDIDFEHERREEVIQYIYAKYGRERAGLTAEVISYRPRSAIRDVGKALGLSLDAVDRLAKRVEHWEMDIAPAGSAGVPPASGWHGQAIAPNDASSLEKPDRDRLAMLSRETRPSREKQGQSAATDASFHNSPSARGRLTMPPAMPPPSLTMPPIPPAEDVVGRAHPTFLDGQGFDVNDPVIQHLLKLTRELLGFPRHLSQHVGGFVITRGLLCELVPIENAAMEARTVIEWDKDDIEAMGMLKVDVLGLGMLTCIRKGFELLDTHYGRPLTLATIPAEDPAVYDMICAADTVGVFQIESRAQMTMLPRLKPRNYYDLVIEVAIVRPGPIVGDMVHPYLRRRNGQEPVVYPDEKIERVLGKTLGVPLFQEQAMALAVVAAGFTPGEAEMLRRAITAWKSRDAISRYPKRFIEGMLKNGYAREFAEQCFKRLLGFSEYGFPESHAASFALLVYASAWQKRYYPAAFAAALLNSLPMGFYGPAQIVRDAQDHDVTVLPADVNRSAWDCTLEGSAGVSPAVCRVGSAHHVPAPGGPSPPYVSLRLGLRMINGLRREDAEMIVRAVHQQGPYGSIEDLWRESGVSAAALRRLAQADAFGSMGLSRQYAIWKTQALRGRPLPLLDSCDGEQQA